MTVRMRTTAAGPWGTISAGKTGRVPDAIGRAMIAAGSATADYPYEEPTVIEAPEVSSAALEPSEAAVLNPPRRRRKRAQMQEPGVSQGDKRPARDDVH